MKKILKKFGLIAFAIALMASTTPNFALALGTNGSFEDATVSGDFATRNAGDMNITGWTVGMNGVDQINTYWTAQDLAQSLDMNALDAGSISQNIPTTIGNTYNVIFYMSGNPDGAPSLKVLRVSATGAASQDFNYDTTAKGTTKSAMNWEKNTYSFQATSPSTTLTFESQIAGAFGPALDNVVITEIPATPACNGTSTFDASSLGSVNGQEGWSVTGPFDQAVVNNTYGYPTFGCKSLRISDAITSGSFGDQIFSPSTVNEAGETDALNNGMSGGVRQSHFEAQFDLASAMSTLQPGMHLSVSPDRGDGARMSYLRFEDQADGIHVFFDDVQGTTNPANFVETDIATITRAPHTIKFSMDFIDGPSNDVVKIYIDGVLKTTGTTWENYYRFDPESNPTLVSNSRTVDSLLFRESSTANTEDTGKGFLIDNFSELSNTPAPAPADSCPADTTKTLVETKTVNSSDVGAAQSIAALVNGQTYLLVSTGTWQNSQNLSDTEYASIDNWATHMNGYDINPYMLGEGEFDVKVDGAFVNWGSYSPTHEYSHLYTGTGSPVSLLVFDGNSNTNTQETGWYGDNSGTLSVAIYSCVKNTPPPVLGTISGMKYNDLNRNGKKDANELGLAGWVIRLKNGNTTITATTDAQGNYSFTNLVPGTYKVRETHKAGWKRMSKNPKPIVIVDGSTTTDVNFGNAQKHKEEKEDNDKDDDRDDQSGSYHAHHGKSNYDKEQDKKDHESKNKDDDKKWNGKNN